MCPCPRCYIKKDDIVNMGTSSDNKFRRNIRIDNSRLHSIIRRLRDWIFKRGYVLTSKMIKRVTDPISILPVHVSKASKRCMNRHN